MIYLTLGEGIRQGLTLYKDLHDNKPPLLYLIAAVSGSLFWFKAILAFWNLATIVLFWKLTRVLFPENEKLSKVATIIFAILTTIPLLEGNIANAEIFMIGPIILGFLILLSKKISAKNLIFSGVLFAIATLFKVPGAFDIGAIIFLWFVQNSARKEELKIVVKRSIYLLLGFLTPILLTFAWYYFKGTLQEYIVAAFLQNVGYLSSFRPADIQKSFLERNGPLLIRGIIVLTGFFLLYLKKKNLSWQFIFLTGWLLLTLFSVTLSERPYPHYLIQAVPPISFLLAILFAQKTFEQSLVVIPLALAFFVPVYFKFWYYPTFPYYLKFLKFATNQLDRNTYFSTFGKEVVTNYEIADFLVKSTTKEEKIFVWEKSEVLYALTKRFPPTKFVSGYHIKDFSSKNLEAQKVAEAKPNFIVLLPDSEGYPELVPILRTYYVPILLFSDKNVEVWKLIASD